MHEISEPYQPRLSPEANITDFLERQATERPDHGLFAVPDAQDQWTDVSARDARERVRALAKGLIAAGIQPGETVGLLASTRLEWTLVDFAIWYAGAVTVPVYETSSVSQVSWIIEDSDVRAVVTGNEDLAKTVRDAVQREGLPELIGLWTMDPADGAPGSGLEALVALGADVTDEELETRRSSAGLADLATIIYTSGTTGRPKGCELTHENFAELVNQTLLSSLGDVVRQDTSTVLFIPLAHVFARFVSVLTVAAGARCGHVSDIKRLSVSLQTFQPSFVLAVPRVFEKIYNAALLNAQSGGKEKIFRRGADVAIRWSRALDSGQMTAPLRLQRAFYSALVYRRIRTAMGGRLAYAVSGGGPLSTDLAHFFRGVGVTILEGYGLTETTAPITVGRPDRLKIGTVGHPLGGNQVRIAEDGEILTRGTSLMRGYHNRPEANEEAFEDGWFRTGDLGALDDDGFLTITGRKKELLVTAGGKNVAPAMLEDAIRSDALVSQVMVVGDGKPFIGVLLTLDEDALKRWKADHNISATKGMREVAADPALRADIQDAINQVNATVSHAEGIKKFVILDQDLTEESNELTPTMKVKRYVVAQRYAADIERLYAGKK